MIHNQVRIEKISVYMIFFSVLFFSYCGNPEKDATNREPSVRTRQIIALKTRLLKNIHYNSDLDHQWSLLEWGTKMYTDRGYTYIHVPPSLKRQLLLCPANDDKFSDPESKRPFISFQVKKDVKVYIIYTTLSTRLEQFWLNERAGWKKENFVVDTTLWEIKANRLVRSKIFPRGSRVELRGNGCLEDNCDMYTVVIVPLNDQN